MAAAMGIRITSPTHGSRLDNDARNDGARTTPHGGSPCSANVARSSWGRAMAGPRTARTSRGARRSGVCRGEPCTPSWRTCGAAPLSPANQPPPASRPSRRPRHRSSAWRCGNGQRPGTRVAFVIRQHLSERRDANVPTPSSRKSPSMKSRRGWQKSHYSARSPHPATRMTRPAGPPPWPCCWVTSGRPPTTKPASGQDYLAMRAATQAPAPATPPTTTTTGMGDPTSILKKKLKIYTMYSNVST
ncbi:hypothetical protein BRADI_3g09905v3 [Brachypodium distachyon]|uniref:Uncharacterized protein n=1 Tax=Brachypodium distachyon TaxID=15368 RepID=A0A0Q3I1H5_BRADI|nr:hypothetical protein BRADI_3g09905v3 [Brachypodium distachyon]